MSLENLTTDQQYFADSIKSAGIPITQSALQAKFEEMADAEGLVFKNPGEQSAWWRWLKSIAITPWLWIVEYLIETIIPNQFVKTASGSFLDVLAWGYGLARKAEASAVGLITFSRDSIGTTLNIPLGTVIKTAPINGVVYKVISTIEMAFGVNDFEIQVPVKAELPGIAHNLAAGYFIILAQPITGISAVNNASDWLTLPGADKEKDSDFRARIRGHFATVSDHHVNSVYKSIIAEQTGFKYDRIFIDHTLAPRGPGSADAVVLFDVGVPSQSYLDAVNNYIRDEGYHGHGDDLEVKAMPGLPINLIATVWVPSGFSQEQKDSLKNGVEQMIRCAFRENTDYDVTLVWPYSRFSMGKLSGELISRFSDLESIEFNQGDIVSALEVPQLTSLIINVSELI
jgi:uncharacterized phage protein gp47/JayE